MRKSLLVVITTLAVLSALTVTAERNIWLYSNDGNHVSLPVEKLDSISFVEPGAITLNPEKKTLDSNGGRFSVAIQANKAWTATVSDKTALSISKESGTGDDNISVLAQSNADAQPFTSFVTFTLSDGTTKYLYVTVDGIIQSVAINKESFNLQIGKSETLYATTDPVGGTVTWSSDNEDIATVDENGVVLGIAEGYATITAMSGSKKAICYVGVGQHPIPVISEPDANHAKIAIHIPDGTECYGITFHGSQSQDNWSLEDWEFEAVDGAAGWYVAEVDILEEADSQGGVCYGKPCLLLNDQTIPVNWGTQWTTGTLLKGDDVASLNMGGEANKVGFLKSGVVYFNVEYWQAVPCAATPTITFKFKAPACEEIGVVDLIGSLSDWNDIEMEYNENTGYWEVEAECQENAKYKFRADGTWDNQPQYYDEETGEWNIIDSQTVTSADVAAGSIVIDWSNPEMYQWSNCAPAVEPNEAQSDVTFTWNGQDGFALADGDVLCITGNFDTESWGDSQREMTANGDGTYSWTGDIPAAFELKIIVRPAVGDVVWGSGDNIKLTIDDEYPYSFDMSIPYPAE